MALTYHSFKLILQSIYKHYNGFDTERTMLTLGVQDSFVDLKRLRKLCDDYNVASELLQMEMSGRYVKTNIILKRFNIKVYTLDYSDFEGADLILDLNIKTQKIQQTFDIVLDGGTLEHIYHLDNALQNIDTFTKLGGLTIHLNPTSNHVDHGFYSFSPTFYYDYYKNNGYEVLDHYLIEVDLLHYCSSWKCYQYDQKKFYGLSFGGWGTQPLATYFSAIKRNMKSNEIIPQQSAYLAQWSSTESYENSVGIVKKYCKNLALAETGIHFIDRLKIFLINKILRIYRTLQKKPKPTFVIKY